MGIGEVLIPRCLGQGFFMNACERQRFCGGRDDEWPRRSCFYCNRRGVRQVAVMYISFRAKMRAFRNGIVRKTAPISHSIANA